MPYSGQVYKIPAHVGGWNNNPNTDLIPPESMVDCSNINLHDGGRGTRGGTAKVNSTPITDSPQIMSVFQFIKKAGTLIIVTGTADGKIQKNYATQIKDGLGTNKYYDFTVFEDNLYICNGHNVPQVWDGVLAATYSLGLPAACIGALAGVGAGNVENGAHSYKVTFVTASGETTGSAKSNVVTVVDKTTDGQVSLTGIAVGPTGTTSRKVYRTVTGDTGDYKLLTTLGNNTATTYTDNTADASLTSVLPTTNSAALIPSDWTGNNFPKAMIKHGRGASERLWAYGCPLNPEAIYASDTGTANFTDAKVIKITIETGDGSGIVGMVEYGDRLIPLGKRKPYLIDDTELDTANWGYVDGQWDGGVAHNRLIVNTPNDVIAMSEEGNIYSIITAQTYGDYVAQSLTRPVFIDQWIRDNIDLSKINQFHMVYDSVLRAVKIFMVRKGQTYIDMCLVYFIDRGPEGGWVKHQFADTYFASCSTEVAVSIGVWKVYTGGVTGHVYTLEEAAANDDGVYYCSSFLLPELTFDNPRIPKRYDKGWLVIKPQGEETITVNLTVDGEYITGGALLVDENGNNIGDENGELIGGGALVDWTVTSTGASDKLKNLGFTLGITGIRIQAEIFNNVINEKFFVSQILFDHTPLGARVA